ncbi:MAG: hypothetical protein AAF585_28515 [Verrucomicrobiota bacterium]
MSGGPLVNGTARWFRARTYIQPDRRGINGVMPSVKGPFSRIRSFAKAQKIGSYKIPQLPMLNSKN